MINVYLRKCLCKPGVTTGLHVINVYLGKCFCKPGVTGFTCDKCLFKKIFV